jgi:retron-type reverse transcriptase
VEVLVQRKEKYVMQMELFPDYHRTNMFEKLCSTGCLRQGFKAVKKNKGSPGIDGVSISSFAEDLEKELIQLKEDLESWNYKPQPVRRVEIPKPGNAGVRLLGIP